MMDTDGSGALSFTELQATMRNLSFTNDEIKDVLKHADANGDGEVDFEEFLHLISTANADSASGKSGQGAQSHSFPFNLVVNSHRITSMVDALFNNEVAKFGTEDEAASERRYQDERRRRRLAKKAAPAVKDTSTRPSPTHFASPARVANRKQGMSPRLVDPLGAAAAGTPRASPRNGAGTPRGQSRQSAVSWQDGGAEGRLPPVRGAPHP